MNIREERFKLFVNYLNGMAIGLFIAGTVTWPLAYIIQSEAHHLDSATLSGAVALCLFGSIVLHMIGQFFLELS